MPLVTEIIDSEEEINALLLDEMMDGRLLSRKLQGSPETIFIDVCVTFA